MLEEKPCKKCKQKNAGWNQIMAGIFGSWILGTSIYGSFILFHKLVMHFKLVFGI